MSVGALPHGNMETPLGPSTSCLGPDSPAATPNLPPGPGRFECENSPNQMEAYAGDIQTSLRECGVDEEPPSKRIRTSDPLTPPHLPPPFPPLGHQSESQDISLSLEHCSNHMGNLDHGDTIEASLHQQGFPLHCLLHQEGVVSVGMMTMYLTLAPPTHAGCLIPTPIYW